MANFKHSILSLKSRAKRARHSALLIGAIILTLGVYAFTFVAYRYTVVNNPFADWPEPASKGSEHKNVRPEWSIRKDGSPEAIFNNRIEQVLAGSLGKQWNDLDDWLFTSKGVNDKSPVISADYNPKVLEDRLNPLLTAYERYSKAKKSEVDETLTSDASSYVSIISSLMLTIGVVGFIVLIIQTAVTFIRYYVRLAELYEAQADALSASDGDPEVAINFIEKFSPLGIDFGKLPTSSYEKSLETIIELLKSKK